MLAFAKKMKTKQKQTNLIWIRPRVVQINLNLSSNEFINKKCWFLLHAKPCDAGVYKGDCYKMLICFHSPASQFQQHANDTGFCNQSLSYQLYNRSNRISIFIGRMGRKNKQNRRREKGSECEREKENEMGLSFKRQLANDESSLLLTPPAANWFFLTFNDTDATNLVNFNDRYSISQIALENQWINNFNRCLFIYRRVFLNQNCFSSVYSGGL